VCPTPIGPTSQVPLGASIVLSYPAVPYFLVQFPVGAPPTLPTPARTFRSGAPKPISFRLMMEVCGELTRFLPLLL
jgi:hypothetical protein